MEDLLHRIMHFVCLWFLSWASSIPSVDSAFFYVFMSVLVGCDALVLIWKVSELGGKILSYSWYLVLDFFKKSILLRSFYWGLYSTTCLKDANLADYTNFTHGLKTKMFLFIWSSEFRVRYRVRLREYVKCDNIYSSCNSAMWRWRKIWSRLQSVTWFFNPLKAEW